MSMDALLRSGIPYGCVRAYTRFVASLYEHYENSKKNILMLLMNVFFFIILIHICFIGSLLLS